MTRVFMREHDLQNHDLFDPPSPLSKAEIDTIIPFFRVHAKVNYSERCPNLGFSMLEQYPEILNIIDVVIENNFSE